MSEPIAIVGSAFRLPGNVNDFDALWTSLCEGLWENSSTLPPASRTLLSDDSRCSPVRAGWVGELGVEQFDPSFFGITPGEADILRPNSRLSLELAWEALERAGIPASSIRGKNVSVSIAMGSEDGWDMRRYAEEGSKSFDHVWAQNADPSGVAGRVAHFLDLQGATAMVSGACASGGVALDYGTPLLLLNLIDPDITPASAVHTLMSQGAEIAIVGSVTTHFTPAPFVWAREVGAMSKSGRCWTFSENADGYSPSVCPVVPFRKTRSLNHVTPWGRKEQCSLC